LLKPRDLATGVLRRVVVPLYARRFAERNLEPAEIETSLEADLVRVQVRGGAELYCPAERAGPLRALAEIPGVAPGTERAVLHYLLRFKFPHFDPVTAPDMSELPAIARGFLVHLQHVNTLAELAADVRDEFAERFELREDERVLEAGPYLGFGTVRLATRAVRSRIVSAEPMRRNLQIARRNIEANASGRAEVHLLAVGGFDGEGSIIDGGFQGNSLVSGVVEGHSSSSRSTAPSLRRSKAVVTTSRR